jgi:hypothetical protein
MKLLILLIENCYTKNSFGILGIKSTIYLPNYSIYSSYEMETQMGSASSRYKSIL